MTAYLWNTESLSANECESYLDLYSRSGYSHYHNYDSEPLTSCISSSSQKLFKKLFHDHITYLSKRLI